MWFRGDLDKIYDKVLYINVYMCQSVWYMAVILRRRPYFAAGVVALGVGGAPSVVWAP